MLNDRHYVDIKKVEAETKPSTNKSISTELAKEIQQLIYRLKSLGPIS